MRKNENGRSMIEMLGVLAIIGVLSVGGIYGYTTAMTKYKANEIVQTASMLATLAHSAAGGEGAAVSLADSGLTENPGGVYVAMNATKPDGGVTTITISCYSGTTAHKDLTEDICNAVDGIKPNDATSQARAGYSITCTKCSTTPAE